MSHHSSHSDPSAMDAAERTAELARMLAKGLVRLRRLGPSPDPSDTSASQKVSENSRNELAVPAEQSVIVHAG